MINTYHNIIILGPNTAKNDPPNSAQITENITNLLVTADNHHNTRNTNA